MFKAGLNVVRIFAVKGSYLERELATRSVDHEVIIDKRSLTEQLKTLQFSYFIANGLPIILPISELMKDTGKKFINIHPSYLPDLRGVDPVPAAILYGRDSGATCHYMNDRVDDGDIIAQVKIPYSQNLDCALLYQLSFAAEGKVFVQAMENGFQPTAKQRLEAHYLSYKIRDADKRFDFCEDGATIVRKIKAFNTKSQGAYFVVNEARFTVKNSSYLNEQELTVLDVRAYQENELVFVFENKLLIKKGRGFLYLQEIAGDLSMLTKGMVL